MFFLDYLGTSFGLTLQLSGSTWLLFGALGALLGHLFCCLGCLRGGIPLPSWVCLKTPCSLLSLLVKRTGMSCTRGGAKRATNVLTRISAAFHAVPCYTVKPRHKSQTTLYSETLLPAVSSLLPATWSIPACVLQKNTQAF